MIAYDNVIVTDADGVLMYWSHGFHMWMVSKGYKEITTGFYNIESTYGITKELADSLVDAFNESAAMRRLPPIKDAIKYIRKLHEEHGYVFHCISAIPNTRDMYEARMENIENLFGKTAFERLTLCGHSANKQELLKEYEGTGCFWIEDLHKNALMGLNVGMRPLLMTHHYNVDDHHEGVKRVYNWKEIYEEITGS
jgi:Cys-tRNA synthase (O-phospho-L-seryl-tRNA:Cys-tRNA synthase)